MGPIESNCPPENGFDSDFGAPLILVTTRQSRRMLVAAQKLGVV
jgi:hypothetical protein